MTDRVLVVGGGIAGLAAAWELTRAGCPVTVVEPAQSWGGKVRTDRVEGYTIECGPDSWVSYRPAAAELVRQVGLGDEIVTTRDPRTVFLRRGSDMVPLPEGMGLVLPTKLWPFVTTRLFTWPQKLRAGADVVLPRSLTGADVSIGELLRRRLGAAVVQRLADPMLGGIYGSSVDELSVDAVLPQLREYEAEYRSLMLASLAQGRKASAAQRQRGGPPPGSPFRSLRTGMGTLVDRLVAELGRTPGVELRLGVAAKAMGRDGTVTRVALSDGSSVAAAGVVLAAPAFATEALLRPDLPAAARLVASVPLGTTAVVSLGYADDAFADPPVGHGFLQATPGATVFSGCTISSGKWQDRAPAGHHLLRFFIPDRSADAAAAADDELCGRVERDAAPALGITKAPAVRHVTRWVGVMPKYTVGHKQRMSALRDAMAAQPSWMLAGSTFDGVGVPDCIASGRSAAGGLIDVLGR